MQVQVLHLLLEKVSSVTLAFIGRSFPAYNTVVWTSYCKYCSGKNNSESFGGRNMLWTIFVILFVLWVLGVVTSYTMGGVIHILLLFALIVLLIRVFQGRRSIV